MVALAVAVPGAEIAPGLRPLGFLPVLGGAGLHRAGTRCFRAAGTTIEPDGVPAVLVGDGVYSRTRNPMYLAGAVILLGVALLLGAATPLLVLPLWLGLASRWFVRGEERVLEARFGGAWLAYRARVPRWL